MRCSAGPRATSPTLAACPPEGTRRRDPISGLDQRHTSDGYGRGPIQLVRRRERRCSSRTRNPTTQPTPPRPPTTRNHSSTRGSSQTRRLRPIDHSRLGTHYESRRRPVDPPIAPNSCGRTRFSSRVAKRRCAHTGAVSRGSFDGVGLDPVNVSTEDVEVVSSERNEECDGER